ncbi:lipase 3 [Galleria mellonella]|uniref:Lipase 3 n=1 Tax=Galleria mellonella TaxID=7137 RepID=A0A6J1X858_GALME|nr:lipase 3 [Galleria mellonella]
MKAVCLLLCLGLARHIAGSIFERRPILERFGEPLENIHKKVHQFKDKLDKFLPVQRVTEIPYSHVQEQKQYDYPQQHVPKLLGKLPGESLQYLDGYYQQHPRVQREYSKVHSSEYDETLQTSKRSSSSESSGEHRPEDMYMPPVYADENMTAQMMKKPVEAPHGDAIEFQGIKMALGPHSQIKKKEQIEKLFADAQMSMKHIDEDSQKTFHKMYELAVQKEDEDVYFNATQLLKKYGYPVEEHTIQTGDGYYLTVFRIMKYTARRTRSVASKGVVLLMHGLYGSADDWLLMGPEYSLAYLLADEGYEVWLGNVRGNKYGRQHVSKHPAQKDFWQFSVDEIARVDLPSLIDYVLQITGQKKLYYVGYDQGTTAFFAMASTMPEYGDKIIKMYAMAPMVYMSHVRSPMVRMIAPTSDLHEQLSPYFMDGEFHPSKELLKTLGGEMCEKEIGCRKICSNLNFVMSGVNLEHMEPAQIPMITGHLPAGGSTRQIKQYSQSFASREFRMYDHGAKINKKMYGSVQPPVYDVSKIQTPVVLYYSEEDWLSHPKDVERLHRELPNVTEYYKVPEGYFAHMDYQHYKKAPEMVYTRLIKSMNSSS